MLNAMLCCPTDQEMCSRHRESHPESTDPMEETKQMKTRRRRKKRKLNTKLARRIARQIRESEREEIARTRRRHGESIENLPVVERPGSNREPEKAEAEQQGPVREPPKIQLPPDVDSSNVVEISVKKKYIYRKCSHAQENAPGRLVRVRPYTYFKVNGKSVRYLNETEEQHARRLAVYAESRRRVEEKETEEERQERLKRDRERRRRKRVDRPDKPSVCLNIPTSVMEPEKVQELRRQYDEFKEYVARICPKISGLGKGRPRKYPVSATVEQRIKKYAMEQEQKAKATATVKEGSENPDSLVNNMLEHGKLSAEFYPKSISINVPIDPELALLETSEETFVPVQVIIQTHEDFDDLLEFETL